MNKEVIDPLKAPVPRWPWLAACRESWIAYQYGDRSPRVKQDAEHFQRWLDRGAP